MAMPMVVSEAPKRRSNGSCQMPQTIIRKTLAAKVMVTPLPTHRWALWASPLPWQRLR